MNKKNLTITEKLSLCSNDLEKAIGQNLINELDVICARLCGKMNIIKFMAASARRAATENDGVTLDRALEIIISTSEEISLVRPKITGV